MGAKKSPILLLLAPTLAPHLQRNWPSNRYSIPSRSASAARSWYSSGRIGYWHWFLIFSSVNRGRRPIKGRFRFPKGMRLPTIPTSHQNRTSVTRRTQGESMANRQWTVLLAPCPKETNVTVAEVTSERVSVCGCQDRLRPRLRRRFGRSSGSLLREAAGQDPRWY